MFQVKNIDGSWAACRDGTPVSWHDTNRDAWRAVDRLMNEPVAASEAASDLLADQRACDEAANRQEWFSALLGLARRKGRKDGWAAHAFREKFGHWPDGLDKSEGPMFPAVAMFLRDSAR